MVHKMVICLGILLSLCNGLICGSATVGEHEIRDLIAKISEMEGKMSNQELRISCLEHTVKVQKDEIYDLKSKLAEVKPKGHEIGKRVLNLPEILLRNIRDDRVVRSVETQNDPESSTEHKMGQNGIRPAEKTTLERRETNSGIGFYAFMSSSERHPSTHHTLVFDNMITNVGNGYNKHSGIFTAPVAGLYAFTCSLTMNAKDAFAPFNIIRNSDIIGTFFIDAESSNDYHSSSTTVVTSLEVGDILYVRTHDTYFPHGDVYSTTNARSSVAGWLIH